MNMEQAKALISEKGWTPQVKVRRETKKTYLYAAKRFKEGMKWRYIGALAQVEKMSTQEIVSKLEA